MKLVLIHQNIESDLLLINSFNSECIICKISDYIFLEQSLNHDTNYNNIIKQILNSVDNLSSVSHLTFVYKFYGDYNIPFFYTSNNSEYPFFNKNIIDLINILKMQNTNIIIDILTCSLNTNEFIDTVSKLKLDLNLNIRYSINCNNNNWILESNNYDIKNEYFTDSILKWSGKLDINYSTENILVPCIVYDISGFNVSKNSVNLSWSEPSDKSSKLLYYHVYKSTDTSNWNIVSSLLPTTTSLLINALNPNTTYYFKILTENSIGKSNLYNILAIKTLNFMGPFINKVFQKNINTKGSETCLGTTSDSSGNAYVIYSIDTNNTNMDIVLQKFDIYGNIIWTKQSQIKCNILETIQLVDINIITDNQNNILFTYCTDNENNNDDFDIVVFKLDPNGDILWSCNYDDNTISDLYITEISPYITVDNFNNVYVVNEKYLDCTTCIKLTKISSSGNIIWSNIIEKHNIIQRFYPIVKFSVSGYLYLSYLQSYTEIVIKKLDLNGQIIWIKSNIFNQIFKYNIDVDVYDNIYCSFSALDNFIESTNQQQTQIIFLKIDSNSNIIWEKQIEKFNTNNTCIYSQIKYDSFFNEILLVYNNLSESKINGLCNIMFIRINPIDGNIINIEKSNMLLNRHCRDYLPIISSNNNGTIYISYESDNLINNSSNIVLVKYNIISSPPTNIQVKNGILSWTSPYNFKDTNSYGYKIRLFDDIIATTTDTFLNLTNLGLTLGEKNMIVTTYNIYGESFDKSAQINFSYNTPFIAQNFIYDVISCNQIDLKWDIPLNNSNFDISGYILSYYDILSPSSVTNILDISTNSTSIKTLLSESTYNLDLIAFNYLGNGIKSSIIITTLSENTRIIVENEPITMATIIGLTNGVSYTFTVVATNIKGDSISSLPSLPIIPITVPGSPTDISGIFESSHVSLSWTAPIDAGGSPIVYYNIFKSTDGIIYTIDSVSDTINKHIIGLSSNTRYYFKISAINSIGEGEQSFTISQATLPSNVGTVIAIKGNALVDLSWNSVSGNGTISGYLVERSIDTISWITDISSSINTFYSSSGLTNGILYYYRVSAINTTGKGVSSTSVSAIPSTTPSVPNTLIVSSVALTSMNLSWNAPASNGSSITYYNIYRSTDSSIFMLYSSSNTTSTAITNLSVNTQYYFKVSAINANGESFQSDSITETTLNIVPNIPTNLMSSNITESSLTLSWTAPASNEGTPIIYYNIYKSIDNNIFIIDSSSNTTLKAITGLSRFTTYYFKVSAINSQGESLFSSTLIQEMLCSIPGSITNLSGIPISYFQIDISWNAPVSSGNYNLFSYNIHVFTVVGTGVGGGLPNVLIPYVDISNINTTFYSLIDLSSNTKYNINIEAYNINGVGESSNINITTLIPLSNPTDLSMNNGILSWNGTSPSYTITLYNTTTSRNIKLNSINMDSTSTNINSEIVSSKLFDPNFIILETGYTNKYYDTKILSLNLGLTKIRVISENAGNLSVDISGEFQFTVALPADPTNIQINGNILSWTEPPNPISSNITGYKIFVYQNSTNSFIEALTINKTNSIILSSSWVPLNTTSFKVISLNTYGGSPPTTGGGGIVIPNPWGVPDPPTNLSAIQNGTGSTSQVYVNFAPPSFTGLTPIIEYTLQASASGETTKTITTHDSSGNILVPFLRIGKEWTFKIKATNCNGSSIWSNITTLIPTGCGTTTGDPIITTIYGERYLLPNINARFLIFNNQKHNYPLYITADCFFLTSKELMESVFISKWSTDYTFMKTLLVKFKNYEITIDMNTLNISYKFIKNIHINIGEIYTDKMILSHHYSANRKRELENNLKFNGKSRKIDLIHEDKIYTLRVSVDLGCADHRNEFVLDGHDMKSGYGAIISKHHQTKLLDLKL